jgi:hypothetical protein
MNILLQKYKQIKGLLFFSYINVQRIFRILTNKPIFHVIGDSHTTSFLHPAFVIHHIGPSTAYKLNFQKSTTMGREKVIKILNKIYKKKKRNVIFVFGELDVRIHINKIVNQKDIPINNVIESTVKSYFNFLKHIKEEYPFIQIYVFNVLPQGEEQNIYNYPYYASRKKRSHIAQTVNNILKQYTKQEKYIFIDIYNCLINKKGQRIKDYVFDDVHFNRKMMKFVLAQLN